MDTASYDTGPAADPVPSAGPPDPAAGPASSQPPQGLPADRKAAYTSEAARA